MATVTVNVEEVALVVGLACLTESRTTAEQRALLHVAERCDKERNRQVQRNITRPGDKAGTRMWRVVPGEIETEGRNAGTEKLVRIRPESCLEREADASRVLEDGDRHVKTSWERKGKAS